MKRRYRLLCQAFLLASCLVISLSAALYAADEEPSLPAQADTADEAPADPGLVIVAVDQAGPAAAAGVARGDILLAVDDTAVNSVADLVTVLADVEAGATVTLQLQHGDDVIEIEVETASQSSHAYLGILPYGAPAFSMPGPRIFEHRLARPAAPLTPTIAMRQVVVVEVLAGSAAEAAGIAVGDVITAVDGKTITNPQLLQAHLANLAPGDGITLTITPAAGEPTDVAVTLGEGAEGQAQLGVRLGMRVTHTLRAENGPPVEFMPLWPGQEPPLRFWQGAPDDNGRRFFWFQRGAPGDQERRFFRFQRPLVPYLYFFAQPHPGWMGNEEFMQSEEMWTMPYPPQPDVLMMAPPLFAEAGVTEADVMVEQSLPASPDRERFY
ncbi:MAG: PDZ domain-containing protein [Caldilineaceae bacterium]